MADLEHFFSKVKNYGIIIKCLSGAEGTQRVVYSVPFLVLNESSPFNLNFVSGAEREPYYRRSWTTNLERLIELIINCFQVQRNKVSEQQKPAPTMTAGDNIDPIKTYREAVIL
jgi:hypothetical protein